MRPNALPEAGLPGGGLSDIRKLECKDVQKVQPRLDIAYIADSAAQGAGTDFLATVGAVGMGASARHRVSGRRRRHGRRRRRPALRDHTAECPRAFRLSDLNVTVSGVDVTDADIAAIPLHNLRVARSEFVAIWQAASDRDHQVAAHGGEGWYAAGVAATCRWMATAPSRLANGLAGPTPAPATRRTAMAYEELIEAEFLAADRLEETRPHLTLSRPGWCEGIRATLRWAWRREGPPPIAVEAPLER